MEVYAWNWTEFCPSGLHIFEPASSNLAPCFQQICLQFPAFILLAIFSAYFYGKFNNEIVRDGRQSKALIFRALVVLGLGLVPLFKILYMIDNGVQIWPIDILLSCTEFIAWIIHFGVIISLRKNGPLSHKGPLVLGVVWSWILALAMNWLHTSFDFGFWKWSLATATLHIFYGLSLLPKGRSHFIIRQQLINSERTSLLRNSYQPFEMRSEETSLGPSQDGHNIFSRILFYWVNPLIRKGTEGKLRNNDDLFELPDCLNIRRMTERLQKYLSDTKSLFKALHLAFGFQFYAVGILRLISDLAGFAGPLLLGGLLRTSETEGTTDESNAYYYAAGLFASTLVSAIAGVHFSWRMNLVSTKMRISLVSAIYRKGLEAKGLNDANPEILNLMSTDTDRIVNSCISFHSLWSIPFQLFTTLYLLYTQVGSAFFAGVLFAVALIPINKYIAEKIGQLSGSLMNAKDKRVAQTSEAMVGAKQIKLQAWEDVFIHRIEELREKEVGFLAKRKYLDALCVFFWATTPVLMSLLTFGTAVLSGQSLTAAKTYTSVALLNMLIGPLNAFPWVLNGLTEAWVSLKRVQELMNLNNIDLSTYYSPVEHKKNKKANGMPVVLSISAADFCFEQKRNRTGENLNVADIRDFFMENVNLEIRKGELVSIQGSVGSGKSALLNALLGNIRCLTGKVSIQDLNSGFGFASQSSWLQKMTIRENIIWGAIYDETRYKAVIAACALQEDIEILGGDNKGVGEGGRTLSGGQRARISLARAVYQDKQIYILDDILASLDAHVASHIVKNCIFGLLNKKTRIIVTEHKTLLDNSNQIIHVEDGKVSSIDLMNDDRSDCSDDLSYMGGNLRSTSPNLRKLSVQLLDQTDSTSLDSVMKEESKEQGHVNSKVVFSYWNYMSGPVGFGVLVSVLTMQASRNITDAWLAHWVSETTLNSTSNSSSGVLDSNFYLRIYTVLALLNSAITLVRSFLFAYAGIKAAKAIHKILLHSVFYTKLQFFDVTPLGRILNRFSSDTYTIDDSLPFILNILLAQLFGLLGAIIVSLYALPWLALLIVPLVPIYLDLQGKYRNASRDIKRLSSNALSPLYAHFTETLQGLPTIRAMRGANRFRQDFSYKLEESVRAQLSASAAQQWLSLRLQFLGSILVFGTSILTAMTSAHTSNPGMVGLAISYALSINSLLSGVLNAFAETEQEFIAIERVDQYSKLSPEVNAEGTAEAPFSWPFQGVIKFQDVFMSYREHLSPALSGISFETSSYERIGCIGKTGAGKTSIMGALLRVAPVSQGEIIIDCVNIANLPLNVLRSRVSIVPQEPFLFAGNVRENLDPRELHLDSEIWNAITNCLAGPLVQALGGLYGKIETNGSNLSAGQKQLLCLTRALLKSAKIVLIDEGTANLDYESELSLQIVLRNAFKTSTVFIIAHRLNGLLQNVDRVIVIENGKIVEEGQPKVLAADESTYLYKMLEEQKIKN